MFEHIFLCDKQTPLAFPVVPEVNNKILNSSGSTFISSKSVNPALYRFFPYSRSFEKQNLESFSSNEINKVSGFSTLDTFSKTLFKILSSPKIATH